jgi:nifR3 family TIM-barrel protein
VCLKNRQQCVADELGDRVTNVCIGPLGLEGRAFLAPMSGITDIGFRRLARRFGASLVVSEMVASDGLARGDTESRLRAEGAGVDPHVVQIAGCNIGLMGEAARLAEASGARIIDINMGCPAKRVTGGYAGSALMRDLDHAVRLVEAVVAAVKVPVTLKMRLGWDDATCNAPELARRAEAAGVALVTVHGRTRCQFYQGQANWAAIGAVKRSVSIPVVANGDCASFGDAVEMIGASGADGIMVGRASVGRPWLVGRMARYLAGKPHPEPTASAKRQACVEHYQALLELFGPRQGVRHARKHLAAYAQAAAEDGNPVPPALRLRLVTSEDHREVVRLLSGLFDDCIQKAA